eukprot:UN15438
MIPSAAPSITGIVVTLSVTRPGEVLTDEEISTFEEQLANDYGVDTED